MMNPMIHTMLRATTALAVALAGSTAAAAAVTDAAAAPADAAAATAAEISIGDIVVTAQRRQEKQRDVPISITVLSEETLAKAGVTTTTELAKVTPGVVLPLYGAFILPSIRGISSSGVGLGDNPNVAIYVDGVYQASQSAGLGDLPDVQSVQILKGPQGALYGQNAAGGAIIIDTIAPSFTTRGRASVGYGNFDDKTANGYITGSLTRTLAAMVSGSYRKRDGVNVDLLRGGHDEGLRAYSGRAKLLWQPGDATSFTLGGYYAEHDDSGVYSNAPLNGNSLGVAIARLPCAFGGLACLNLPVATKPHTFAMNPKADTRIRSYGISLRAKIDIADIGTINTITAYNRGRVVDNSDVDSSPVNTVDFYFKIKEHDVVQELNFTSEHFGNLTFSAGAFFLSKFEEYTPQLTHLYASNAFGIFNTAYPALNPIFQFGTFSGSDKKSYAAYLEANYDLTPQLTITAAGRYAYEKVRVSGAPLPANWQPGDPPTPRLPDPRGAFTFRKFTPRAVIRFRPDDYNTVYASYSQGFKSGYVNAGLVNNCTPSPACIDAPVAPETVDAFEIGYKAKLAHILDLNLAAFHYRYRNIQVYIYDTTPPGVSRFQNAAAGRVNGFEFDADLHATPDLSLKAGGSYLDAKYTSFPAATVYIPSGFGNSQAALDVSGRQLMRTPKWTLNGSITYTRSMKAGEAGLYLGANYNSGLYFDPNNRVHQPAYALLDTEISFAPAALPGARIVLWGKNLTNHDYLQSVLESQIADSGTYADPRTYGVRVEYKF